MKETFYSGSTNRWLLLTGLGMLLATRPAEAQLIPTGHPMHGQDKSAAMQTIGASRQQGNSAKRGSSPIIAGGGTQAIGVGPGTGTDPCRYIIDGSFEVPTVNPPSGQIQNITSPNQRANDLAGWVSANNATPEYYSTLASTIPFSDNTNPNSPYAFFGQFTPRTGNGAVGLCTFWPVGPTNSQFTTPGFWHEYVTRPLSQPLVKGTYYASFWARQSSYALYASRLGLNLSKTNPVTYTSSTDPTPPLTFSITKGFQSSTVVTGQNWVKVEGSFTISAAEAGSYYVSVGNFDNPATHDPDAGQGLPYGFRYGYYFVDDIALTQVPEALPGCVAEGTNGLVLRTNTTCVPEGASVIWEGPNGYVSYALNPIVRNLSDQNNWGTYQLTVTLANGETVISYADVYPLGITAIKAYTTGNQYISTGATVCQSENILFSAFDATGGPYTWSVTGGAYSIYGTAPGQSGSFWIRADSPTGTQTSANYTVTVRTVCPAAPGTTPTTISKSFNFTSIPRGPACGSAPRPAAETSKLSAYPSPAGESLTVQVGDEVLQDIRLFNSQGYEVKHLQPLQKTGHLNVRDLPNGLYMLRAKLVTGETQTMRIGVEH